MDAIEAIRTRRSVRSFLVRPVERPLLEGLIVDASHAPFTPIAKTGAGIPEGWLPMAAFALGLAEPAAALAPPAPRPRHLVAWADD